MTGRLVPVLCAAALLATACASASTSAPPAQTSAPARPSATAPTLITAGAGCSERLGGTVSFQNPGIGLALRVTTARPRVVSHALASYAHGPANGHFLIVDVTLKNLSQSGYRLDPTQFVFTTSGGRRLTVDSGNAPFSGASQVLDPTFLVPQGTERGPLIYDTPDTHGRIILTDSGKAACTWTV